MHTVTPHHLPLTRPLIQPLARPLIGFGQVRHTRLKPARHAFAYATYFVMLPLRSLAQTTDCYGNNSNKTPSILPKPAISLNTWAALSFYDRDHGDGRGPERGGALAWLDELLHHEGIDDADGEVWLHCYPRVLGYTFKPVSFWYCHRKPVARQGGADDGPGPASSGSLRAIVVEVNNTFGERHCYLLDSPRYGQELRAAKVFHVSPFCEVQGEYRFRFLQASHNGSPHTVVRIDYDDALGPLLQTSVSGQLEPLTPRAVRRALWRYPAMTLGLIARIHWQALKLAFKRIKLVAKPPPPDQFVSR